MKLRISTAFVLAGLTFPAANAFAVPVPIDLGSWIVEQYQFPSQGNANWAISGPGNSIATQTINADASILRSNFDISGQQIAGTWRVLTRSDDDFMGFVFGYQNRGQYYLFDWKQGNQSHVGAFAERGMSIKVVDTGGGDPSDFDLWHTAGSANVSLLRHNTTPWADLTDYDFILNFGNGIFNIRVLQGVTELENWTVLDNTFTSGEFGFYNYSQGQVQYEGFTIDPDPPPIPEPGTVILIGLGLCGLGLARRRGR